MNLSRNSLGLNFIAPKNYILAKKKFEEKTAQNDPH